MRTLVLALAATVLYAQPSLKVDPTQNRHPISPDIYGVNEYADANGSGRDTSMIGQYPFTARRWGGDNSVSYNWQLDSNSTAGNYFFETFPIDKLTSANVKALGLSPGTSFEQWTERTLKNNIRAVATVPIIGWTVKNATTKQCSFSIAKYGPQQKSDIYAPDCGNGTTPNGKSNIVNDPTDTFMQVGPDFAASWVASIVNKFGPANQGGIWLWELDNEPTWWHAVHVDIHPNKATFDEMLDRNIRWAQAIKSADPSAMVGGPTPPGWESFFYSASDLYSGWGTGPDYKYWNKPTDCNAHFLDGKCGGFLPWYLDQMQQYETQNGVRLVDYLDIHAYVGPDNLPGNRDPKRPDLDTLRLTSTRTFWDPNYMPQREDMKGMDKKWGTGNPQLIPRFKNWIDSNYPGTKLAITEYNWGAADDITGAIAQADLFGIFGREGVDLATMWGTPTPKQPASFAWRMFLSYDGQGSTFGETSIDAETADADQISIFAAERHDGVLTVMLLNKTPNPIASPLTIPGTTAQVFQYSAKDLTKIIQGDDISPTDSGNFNLNLPGYSITLLAISQQ